MRDEVIAKILEKKVIAILRGQEPDVCVQLAAALQKGGIELMEVPFDQRDSSLHARTTAAISAIRALLGNRALVGAGTVVSPALVELAAESGASFIVSPNADTEVIARTRALGLVSLPGAMTPTEIFIAHSAGADFVKLFPAGTLGAGYIKAVRAPLSGVRLVAVGGIGEHNLAEFLAAGACGVGIGGNLVNADWIRRGEWNKITALAGAVSQAAAQHNAS